MMFNCSTIPRKCKPTTLPQYQFIPVGFIYLASVFGYHDICYKWQVLENFIQFWFGTILLLLTFHFINVKRGMFFKILEQSLMSGEFLLLSNFSTDTQYRWNCLPSLFRYSNSDFWECNHSDYNYNRLI